ncbi:hypothetical protein N7456_012215 [Penicillium angulare]|uniref:Uncharacterized protein n=1 Tax=Penicillium angulare TaxID=116970 RepID=A0A9W9EVD6_9EURO|nr:hypothetical protein N7456_012215 [Penicillium angulare]
MIATALRSGGNTRVPSSPTPKDALASGADHTAKGIKSILDHIQLGPGCEISMRHKSWAHWLQQKS